MNTTETISQQIMIDRDKLLRSDRKYWRVRRAQDIIISAIALLILFPFMLLVALIIVIDSPGASPIFVQDRMGRDGKVFRFYKFRSMYPDADKEIDKLLKYNEMEGPAFKMKQDPRVTRVGKFIRKTCIDELPQLWNVLRGEMSLVGPRPPLPREVVLYNEYQAQRLYVTPGLTCYWQIQPQRNNLSFDEWIELDLRYIQERSFLTDWKILLKTFAAVFSFNGI